MRLNEYQTLAYRTARPYESRDMELAIGGLGLAGEAGEAADYIKKVVGHSHPLDKDKLVKEIGDALWYVAYLATAMGVSLEEVALVNIEKLRARYPEGFSTEKSINRTE